MASREAAKLPAAEISRTFSPLSGGDTTESIEVFMNFLLNTLLTKFIEIVIPAPAFARVNSGGNP
jgi:hypothetical protein